MDREEASLPGSSSESDAVALRQAVGRALGRVRGGEDVLVAGHAVGGGDGVVGAAREARERDLDDLEARGRLAVPGAVERDVHVGRVGVEGVPDGRAVRHEREARGRRLGGAVGVAVDAVAGRQHELAARLEAGAGEGLGAPDGEARRVSVPDVAGGQGVTNYIRRVVC